MKIAMRFINQLTRFIPYYLLAGILYLIEFFTVRMMGSKLFWIGCMALLLTFCAVLKNLKTSEEYRRYEASNSESPEQLVAERFQYVKFLGDLRLR
jgi:hypothetical protein